MLLEINRSLPADTQRRYDGLIAKRRAEVLTPEEYDELLRLTDGNGRIRGRDRHRG